MNNTGTAPLGSKNAQAMPWTVQRNYEQAALGPLDWPYPLRPDIFDGEGGLCFDAQHRLEALLCARGALHGHEAAREPGDGDSAHLSAALDPLADEVATLAYGNAAIMWLAEAERLTGPLVASAHVTAVLDADGSKSIEDFMPMLISATEANTPITPTVRGRIGFCGGHYDAEVAL